MEIKKGDFCMTLSVAFKKVVGANGPGTPFYYEQNCLHETSVDRRSCAGWASRTLKTEGLFFIFICFNFFSMFSLLLLAFGFY